jgi:hypothetical protein
MNDCGPRSGARESGKYGMVESRNQKKPPRATARSDAAYEFDG